MKAVFQEMNIRALFEKFEEDSYILITNLIAQLDESQGLKKEVFEAFLGKVYKRRK